MGSSSIKFASFECSHTPVKSKLGSIKNIGEEPVLSVNDSNGNLIQEMKFEKNKDYGYFFNFLFEQVAKKSSQISAVGHRVVHGGNSFDKPIMVNASVLTALEKFIPFAPLHQPFNLKAIEVVSELLPNVPQVACFDTAFHRTHPPVADYFGIPRAYTELGIRRYGFHGLSYEFVFRQLQKKNSNINEKKIIVAHLGNGASMCAIKNGMSIDSTMGFTALDGLMMGTRCGSLDPGVVLYFMKFKNMSHDEIEKMLYQRSGLLGISDLSSNMQTLLSSQDPKAKEAVDVFVYRARQAIGALSTSLNGLDMLVFTGGIGENAAIIREKICQGMEWLGIELDSKLNKNHSNIISQPTSKVEVTIIPTDEEWVIADHTYHLLTTG